MKQQHYLLGEVAKMCGTLPHRLAYLLCTGAVPEPVLWIGGKRVFNPREVEHIRQVVAERAARKEKGR